MEEKKIINMNSAATVSKEQEKKLSYEKLNELYMNASQENQQMRKYIQGLHKQMEQMEIALQSRRIDYLLKIIELKDSFADEKFTSKCIEEIKESLTIPEEETSKNN